MVETSNACEAKPWWKSQKIMVFLIVLVLVTVCLMTLILAGKLEVSPELVGSYLLAVAGTGSSVILGRAGEGAAAALRRPTDGDG